MKLKEIVLELMVSNVNCSIQFYENLLGFHLIASAPEGSSPTWAEISKDSYRLMLQEREEMLSEIPCLSEITIGGTLLIVFRFQDQEMVRQIAKNVGKQTPVVKSLHETEYGTTEFAIRDPDGYILLFSGEVV